MKKKAKALNELLVSDDPAHFRETLDVFFECWITNERTDSEDSVIRADRYYAYKNLRDFLEKIIC